MRQSSTWCIFLMILYFIYKLEFCLQQVAHMLASRFFTSSIWVTLILCLCCYGFYFISLQNTFQGFYVPTSNLTYPSLMLLVQTISNLKVWNGHYFQCMTQWPLLDCLIVIIFFLQFLKLKILCRFLMLWIVNLKCIKFFSFVTIHYK